MLSKNRENRPRGSLGSGTLGPGCSVHGVTTTGLGSFDHAIVKKVYIITSFCNDNYFFLLKVAGADGWL